MTTQPALVAKQVRLKEWAQQIRDCQNRPKGMESEMPLYRLFRIIITFCA